MQHPTWHYLKTYPPFFRDTLKGLKDFEFRLNDRNYTKGDYIVLEEWEPKTKYYSDRRIIRKIKYVFQGYFGLPEKMVILGLERP